MNVSIGDKKVLGSAAPFQERLKDYHRPGSVTVGIRAVDLGIEG